MLKKTNSLLRIANNYVYDSLLPLNLSYFYNFGSLLGLCLIIQIISGIFLAMFYSAHVDLAFNSVEFIMREISYGWLIRYTHANGAAFFFIMVYLHIARGLLYGSYIGKKSLTWIIGVILFLLMIITAFLGYSLVWGSMSYWACVVITNLLSSIPYVGNILVEFIWGNFSVGNSTLNRFYSLHYLLPFIIVGLTITHLIALHDVGGSNPLGISKELINFNPYYTFKDILGFIILILCLLIFVCFAPNVLGHSDNYIEANSLVTPAHILPEFYLLPFYAILRAIPNKRLGVIFMILAIVGLFLLPFLHNHILNTSKFRPIYLYSLYTFFICFLLLTWIGQALVIEPYILIGQLLTFYYFFFLFFIIPIISFFEFILFLI